MALISVNNLERVYGDDGVKTYALRNATFEIEQGEFVSIMGPSGSGKSTLMHILGLLDRQTAGKYIFGGKNVNTIPDTQLALLRNKKVGFVFQAFNLLPRTTVLDNVKLPLMYSRKKMDRVARAEEVLASVGLSERLHHYSNEISGGEKQRVAIARALVNKPAIIFADEPTGNLDSQSGLQVMGILQKLNKDGHTIILVTHETYTASCAKRIIHIKDGAITSDKPVTQRHIVATRDKIK
jgi:putative ABC transport system ATP-binding protein